MLKATAREDGYYIVLEPAQHGPVDESSMAAAGLRSDVQTADFNKIIRLGQPLPLTRAASLERARVIEDKLRTLGIESLTVSDEDLRLRMPPKRIRALELAGDSVTAIAVRGPKISARWQEIALLVTGRLLLDRTEVEERKRHGQKQLLDTRHLSSDDAVLDLYTSFDESNWRIIAGSFDFSCLGNARSVTTFENFSKLIDLLRERATNAQFDDSYTRVRPALASAWPLVEQIKEGISRRHGSGRFNSATVTTSDNEAQFTRYSRLQHWLRLRESAKGR